MVTPQERGGALRAFLAKRGWSRAQFSAYVGLHPEFVHALLSDSVIMVSEWVSQALEQTTGIPAEQWRDETVSSG